MFNWEIFVFFRAYYYSTWIHCSLVNITVNAYMIMNVLNIMPHSMWLYIFLTRGNKKINKKNWWIAINVLFNRGNTEGTNSSKIVFCFMFVCRALSPALSPPPQPQVTTFFSSSFFLLFPLMTNGRFFRSSEAAARRSRNQDGCVVFVSDWRSLLIYRLAVA